MKLAVIVASPERTVVSFIGIKKRSVIPPDIFRRGYYANQQINLSVNGYLIAAALGHDFTTFISEICSNADEVLLFIDERYAQDTEFLADSVFRVTFRKNLEGRTMQNYFSMIISRSLKSFGAFARRFDDAKYQKPLLLPLLNFDAAEVRDLRTLFRDDLAGEGFVDQLDRLLSRIRERQTPKRVARYRDSYFKDDMARYFEYGHERHARLESSVPPHELRCRLSGHMRFGKRYDPDRHFNISREKPTEQIEGNFVSCHGPSVHVSARSHINMFPNNFFGQ